MARNAPRDGVAVMGTEVERKFLVASEAWRREISGPGQTFRQGYLSNGDTVSLRVRIVEESEAFLTIKGARAGMARPEYEYPIPRSDAAELLELASGTIIEKTRYRVPGRDGLVWEVDVFAGALAGLVLAEVELPDTTTLPALPDWLGREVTEDRTYSNASLAHGSLSQSRIRG